MPSSFGMPNVAQPAAPLPGQKLWGSPNATPAPPNPASALARAIGSLGGGGGTTQAGPLPQVTASQPPGAGGAATASAGAGASAGGGLPALGGAMGMAGGGPVSNTTQTDPNTNWLINQIKGRANDSTLGRAIDIANTHTRDAAEGQNEALKAKMAAQGILGSGADLQIQGNMAKDLQRQQAANAANMTLGRQGQVDQMLLGAGGIFAKPAELAQGDRQLALQQYLGTGDLALRQYLGEGNLDIARQQQNFGQQQALLNTLLSMYQ